MSWGGVVQDLNVRFPEEGLARLNLLGGLTNFVRALTMRVVATVSE